MRTGLVGLIYLGMAGVAAAQGAPTPGTAGSNPGGAAAGATTNPTAPPAMIAPSAPPASSAPGTSAPPAPASSGTPAGAGAMSGQDMRELLDAARATAKATRESVDYGRVVPDILQQILAKLDKIEDKVDRIDGDLKEGRGRRR